MTQLAYEIEIASDPAFKTNLTTSGEVAGAEQVAVEGPGVRLKSREVRFHRVRIRTEAGWTSRSGRRRAYT
jgi:alpha-L-rhamnosidase